jgi:hypothetical protein
MTVKTNNKSDLSGLIKFHEVGQTGVFIGGLPESFIEQRKKTHKEPLKNPYRYRNYIVKQHGLRLLTYQEAFVKIDQNQDLKEVLKGKTFYLTGNGTDTFGHFMFNDKGEITGNSLDRTSSELIGKLNTERSVHVTYLAVNSRNPNPLKLTVSNDNYVCEEHGFGSRFVLDSHHSSRRLDGESAPITTIVGVKDAPEVILTGITAGQLAELKRDSMAELSKLSESVGTDNLPNIRMLMEALRIKE